MLHLKHCMIQWTDYGALSIFPDGKECGAWPHPDDADYCLLADRLGYDRDVMAFCREHELAHHMVEQHIHDRPSQVLRAVADGNPLSWPQAAYEEIAAQALQALARKNERPIIGGFDWQAMRAEFLANVAYLDQELRAAA